MSLDEKLAFSVPEAAQAISVSRATAWKEIKVGRLRVVRAGGRTLVLKRDLQAYLDALQAAA